VEVHLCGVRGSTPAPGAAFSGIGGNTSCVAIGDDGCPPTLVLDAGTGLRNVTRLLGGGPFRGTIVLGHLHWDHVMGLPFFPGGDHPDAVVQVLLPAQGLDAEDVLTRIMGPPLFPITPHDLRGSWSFGTYDEGKFDAGGFTVLAREVPHKGGRTMGLRITDGRSSVAYLSDHSPHDLGPGDDGLGVVHPAAAELVEGVDLLVHDAQYTRAELPGRASWGHAAAPYCVTLARHCGVGRVLLFHHDPTRTDEQVHALHHEIAADAGMSVEVAIEGATLRV